MSLLAILAVGERARSFKAVSPGMLPPFGIIFGLFVGFTAAQVWSDNDRASAAVDREASALRSVVILAATFSGEPETRLRGLVSSYIAEAAAQEWPMMAHGKITLQMVPHALAEALQLTLALEPTGPGQQTAQREITAALESAIGCPSPAHQDQPIASQLGQVVVPVLAGSRSVAGDRHGPQRQSARLRDHDGALCDRGSRIRAVDSRLRPTLHRRNIGGARATVAGHADCRKSSIGF